VLNDNGFHCRWVGFPVHFKVCDCSFDDRQ
jgi:hypothetical protein